VINEYFKTIITFNGSSLCVGAVLSKDTQRFVQTVLCATLFQGYDLTEICTVGTIANRLYSFLLLFLSMFF